jgi:hypothetical protein
MHIVLAVLGGIIGLVLGLIAAHYAIPKETGFSRFVLVMLAAGLVGLVFGFIAGAFMGFAVHENRRANAPDSAHLQAIIHNITVTSRLL